MAEFDQRRAAVAPILPGEEAIPFTKARARRGGEVLAANAGQRQIADRNLVWITAAGAAMAAAIAESIKLFDIADRNAGLLRDPGAQADLERAVIGRIEGA